jgi:hypothetical protein
VIGKLRSTVVLFNPSKKNKKNFGQLALANNSNGFCSIFIDQFFITLAVYPAPQ